MNPQKRWLAVSSFTKTIDWPDPTPEMLASREFETIWQVIKSWDVAVPSAYFGYCGATGNHVRAILDALETLKQPHALPHCSLCGWKAEISSVVPCSPDLQTIYCPNCNRVIPSTNHTPKEIVTPDKGLAPMIT